MRHLLLPVTALLLSQALVLAGHGLQMTLLPLRAALEGFTNGEVAFTGTAYFSGFVAGCLITPHVVRRAGHIRAYAVMASSYSAAVLVFDLLPTFVSWMLLRALSGVTIAGLYMILESWLSERSTAETRGSLLSVYTIVNLTMMVAGQQMLNFAAVSETTLFAVAAILMSLAVIPVSLTRALAPAPPATARVRLLPVWQRTPVALLGSIASGMATGAFLALAPLYAAALELETFEITLFLSTGVLGGACFQYPLGRLSDHLDRRLVLLGSGIAGAVASFALTRATGGALLYLAAFCWGGFTVTMYAICLAHANDRAEAGEFVSIGTAILLVNGAASALGAPLASWTMGRVGPGGLFLTSAVILTVFSAAALLRVATHRRPAFEESEPFQAVGEVTPQALELDPRVEGDWTPEDGDAADEPEEPEAA